MDAMAQLPLPAGLGAGTFPAKVWSLVNDPHVRSLRWDSEAQGLLVDRSLFKRELLRPGGAQGPAPHAFRATQFRSFVRQLYRYGFRKVPGRAGAAAPGDAGAWVHCRNPWFRRDRPDLLLRIRRRSAANMQRRAVGPEGRRLTPCGSQQLPGPRPLPNERHGRPRLQPLPRERPPLARRPPCGFHLLHRERPGPARREGPSRFQELYGERPLPAERELLRVPPCHFQGFHGEWLLPPRWEWPSSRLQELYGEQPPLLDRELLRMQPCSFQQLHREQQPPASNPPAAPGTSAPHAPAGSAGCAASTASSSAQNAPAQEESPALDLGLEIEKMMREIRNSLPVKAPSAQGNISVAPESPREDPMNRAAAEEVSSGTESCGNSSPESEEPGKERAHVGLERIPVFPNPIGIMTVVPKIPGFVPKIQRFGPEILGFFSGDRGRTPKVAGAVREVIYSTPAPGDFWGDINPCPTPRLSDNYEDNGKWEEIPYLDLFYYLGRRTDWQKECGIMVLTVANEKCQGCENRDQKADYLVKYKDPEEDVSLLVSPSAPPPETASEEEGEEGGETREKGDGKSKRHTPISKRTRGHLVSKKGGREGGTHVMAPLREAVGPQGDRVMVKVPFSPNDLMIWKQFAGS
ncbi:hypothetical protein DUI87_26500 [Hirundo rustica rustica]|uniref:HSF-type DNA-binding domain-containing protein n=1 Tax=Hirundo rustica rustica TaxID=333673 RepID=A0A3M0J866_HIRRU|nr:hypothetical protein DUI87_26500 [Hirundo rustica rustica]